MDLLWQTGMDEDRIYKSWTTGIKEWYSASLYLEFGILLSTHTKWLYNDHETMIMINNKE